jgi:hypothetical protein
MFVWIPDLVTQQYGMVITASDSTIKDLNVWSAGQTAGIQTNGGNIRFYGLHPLTEVTGVIDNGGASFDGLECDSLIHYCLTMNGPSTVISSKSYWNASIPGSTDFFLNTNRAVILNHSCGNYQTSGGYTQFSSASGTLNPKTSSFPPGVFVSHAQECGASYLNVNIVPGIEQFSGELSFLGLAAPSGLSVTPNTTGTTTTSYDVLAMAADNTGSQAPSAVTITNGAATPNNTIAWNAVPGADHYDVYCTAGCPTTGKVNTSPITTLSYTDTTGAGDGSSPSGAVTSGRTCFYNHAFCIGTSFNGASLLITNGSGSTTYLSLSPSGGIQTNAGLSMLQQKACGAVTAAATIAPQCSNFHVTGTVPITTITPLAPQCTTSGTTCTIQMTPDAGSTWTLATGGNIAKASTPVVNQMMILTYDNGTAKWYPSY